MSIEEIEQYISEYISPALSKIRKKIFEYISTKVDVSGIVIEHYNTLYNNRTGEKYKDIFTFFGIPIIASIILVFLSKGAIDDSIIDSVLSSLSIFTPIMFSLLVAIYTINRKRLTKKKTHKIVKEFKANVSFMIIISLFSIFFLIIYSMKLCNNFWYISVLSFIILLLLGILGLTIFQVLKRWNYLLDDFLDGIKPPEEIF